MNSQPVAKDNGKAIAQKHALTEQTASSGRTISQRGTCPQENGTPGHGVWLLSVEATESGQTQHEKQAQQLANRSGKAQKGAKNADTKAPKKTKRKQKINVRVKTLCL